MKRRRFLETASLGCLGLGLGACSSRSSPDAARRRPPFQLPVVDASWDRITRTTVGLRPYRPTGFVVRVEQFPPKTIVHNYGHGGAGMSLSWGTAHLAAELARSHPSRRAAVLGCGVTGLTTARELQRRGYEVTIYSKDVPPNTTSNMSLAGWTPTSRIVSFRKITPHWEEQFHEAVTLAYQRLQLLAGRRYGISWISHYTPTEDARAASGTTALLPEGMELGQELLRPGEHPFPTTYVVATPRLRIEPSIYLDALVEDFHLYGGCVVRRGFESLAEVLSLGESLIFNCTGLGAKALFDDEELVPFKGQLTALVPQTEIEYGTGGGLRVSRGTGGMGIHMTPRSDGIILGGTAEENVWTTDVNEEERERVVEGHIELFDAMRAMARGEPLPAAEERAS